MAGTNEKYIVVMGTFCSGKSTMINALVGEDVLPSYPFPTTAVITELRYGEAKKIVMYPKKGENIDGHGDKPFSVPAAKAAVKQYVTIDNDAEINAMDDDTEKITSKFEKAELYWPLDMLKNGVVIVDSPRLNDPCSNDVIVKKYLPKADAIIYTLNATHPYQGIDKDELDLLNWLGIKNIIFACTYWNLIKAQGERTAEKVREFILSQTLKHTDLGSEAVHFLASKDGLQAYLNGDRDLYLESGYAEFSEYIKKVLKTQENVLNLKNERTGEKMDKLSKHSKTMAEFKGLITKEKACAKKIDEKQEQWVKTLDGAVKRTEEDFNIVVMGNFSAGKSTMINALIGEDVLPSYPFPTTAVMTELRYGETKKIVMHPKKGENIDGHGDKPFSVPATKDAVEQYVTIDNDAEINAMDEDTEKITSKFEKMELYWPLDMLKNGVVIVDSPGLNDPYSNDVIVKEYLPKADAIIYTLNSTAPYQGTDKNELESLNQYGIKNIIFACTYWDMTKANGERAAEKTRTYCVSQTLKHTDLGSGAVHFLASKDGLHARIENDKDMLTESGYAEFEAFLQDYLTNHKGQDKVKNIASTIEAQAEQMKKHAVILNENTKKDKQTVENNIITAKESLRNLKIHAESILTNFKLKLETKRPSVEAAVKNSIMSLENKVDLDNFRPSTKLNEGVAKLRFWENSSLAEAITEEFQDEYARRLKREITKCCSATVSDKIQSAVKEAAEGIEKDVIVLSERLDAIDNSIGLPEVDTDNGEFKNLLLGIVYGLITQDWFTGATAAAYGGLGRQIGFQFAAGAIYLGIATLISAPISVPVLIISGIVGTIASILSDNNDKKIEKIRKKVLEDMKKAYFTNGEATFIEPTKNSIMKTVDEVFAKASDDIKASIDFTFAEKGRIFESMLDQANLVSAEKEKLVRERNSAVAELDSIVKDAKRLQKEY